MSSNKVTNLIIPEKNLKKEILQANGIYSQDAIKYQVLNGKNGMPAFGGRLKRRRHRRNCKLCNEQCRKKF
jgi:hypothetical protein